MTGPGEASAGRAADGVPVRRVVTGFDEHGRSTTIIDGPVQALSGYPAYPGASGAPVWFTSFPDDVRATADVAAGRVGERPGPGGTRFYVVRIDPGVEIPFHATPTVDYHCVVQGEITCLLEEGEVTVRAGELLVQRATPHGWVNRGTEPFVSVAVMVDAGVS